MTHNINFDAQPGLPQQPSLPSSPTGKVEPGFGATFTAPGAKVKPSPYDLAATSSAPTGPVGEYQEPPVPTVGSAPKSPVPPGPKGTVTMTIKDNTLTATLNVDIGSKLWQQTYTYTATLTPGQLSSLQHSNAKTMSGAMQSIVPPPSYKCTEANNTLMQFPSNMALFAERFPFEYHKFMTNLAVQIFQQIHAQQTQATSQMQQAMKKMNQ